MSTAPVIGDLKFMQTAASEAAGLDRSNWGGLNRAVTGLESAIHNSANGYLWTVSAEATVVSTACNGAWSFVSAARRSLPGLGPVRSSCPASGRFRPSCLLWCHGTAVSPTGLEPQTPWEPVSLVDEGPNEPSSFRRKWHRTREVGKAPGKRPVHRDWTSFGP